MGRHGEVEDVTQEVFIKIYRKLGTFRGEARLSTWIYRIARNEAINAVSRLRPQFETIDDSIEYVDKARNPEEHHERNRSKALVDELPVSRDERQRVAIELRYMGEKSYQEIAEIMDMPIGTVKTCIHRAKAAMKKSLAVIRSTELTI